MQLSHKAATEELLSLKKLLKGVSVASDIVICPSYPSLPTFAESVAKDEKLQIGAQNIHWEEKGAWTGQVSVVQITPFVSWCIVGHSEQRELTGETDEIVQEKVQLLQKHGVIPIVCIGETAQERAAGQAEHRVAAQVESLLAKMTRASLTKMVICYEPIWAISSNDPAEEPDLADMAGTMLLIRKMVAERFDVEAAERLRIIFGGSVNQDNVAALFNEPGVDGALVGSASLRPVHFIDIIKAAQAL